MPGTTRNKSCCCDSEKCSYEMWSKPEKKMKSIIVSTWFHLCYFLDLFNWCRKKFNSYLVERLSFLVHVRLPCWLYLHHNGVYLLFLLFSLLWLLQHPNSEQSSRHHIQVILLCAPCLLISFRSLLITKTPTLLKCEHGPRPAFFIPIKLFRNIFIQNNQCSDIKGSSLLPITPPIIVRNGTMEQIWYLQYVSIW